MAIDHHIPLITDPQKAQIMLQCLIDLKDSSLPVRSWREIVNNENQIRSTLQGDSMTDNATQYFFQQDILSTKDLKLNELDLILNLQKNSKKHPLQAIYLQIKSLPIVFLNHPLVHVYHLNPPHCV